MTTVLIIYLIGLVFLLGSWVDRQLFLDIKLKWTFIWPIHLVLIIIEIFKLIFSLIFPPIWLELAKVLIFNVTIKAHDEPLNNYYNKLRNGKFSLKKLRIKAIKKIAKQNNIIIKELQK